MIQRKINVQKIGSKKVFLIEEGQKRIGINEHRITSLTRER
jgi:hypothetical protein